MTRQRIGGTLSLRGLAVLADPATKHRPDDPQTLRREAEALLAIGLSIADASQALELSPPALAQLLDDRLLDDHITNHLEKTPCPTL